MIGNDMKLDTGIGMCGKAGQGVPVGVGQPHLRMNQMTVGGTQGLAATSRPLTAASAASPASATASTCGDHRNWSIGVTLFSVAAVDQDAQVARQRRRIAGDRGDERHVGPRDLLRLILGAGARRIEDQRRRTRSSSLKVSGRRNRSRRSPVTRFSPAA